MRGREMLDTIENLNPAYIEAAAEKPKVKKAGWLKWGAMAACLAVVVIAGISLLPGNNTVQTSVGGVMREYKNVSVASSEVAIEWPWEYKTLYERFSTIIYDGREYTVKTIGLPADKSVIGEKLGIGEGIGYDVYTEQEYRQDFDVWQVSGISADLMIAAEMDGQFYTFKYDEYEPPATLGEVLDDYSLPQTLPLSHFAVYEDGEETGYYSLSDDDYIWKTLAGCRDAQFVEDGAGGRISRDRITFTATSEALGVYKRAFYVSVDGYVDTNVFDWAYTFYIGEDLAADIISYVQKNAVKVEREPYTYSLVGTLTEIGDGYILVDDSILCADEDDGMVFEVLTTDLRVSRFIDHQAVSTGSIVAVTFTEPVNIEDGNVVSGAVSMAKGAIYDGEVAFPE